MAAVLPSPAIARSKVAGYSQERSFDHLVGRGVNQRKMKRPSDLAVARTTIWNLLDFYRGR